MIWGDNGYQDSVFASIRFVEAMLLPCKNTPNYHVYFSFCHHGICRVLVTFGTLLNQKNNQYYASME